MAVVKMLAKISGTRNNQDWPEIGDTVELPDDEAAGLVRIGLAETAQKTRTTLVAADHVDHAVEAVEDNKRIKARAAWSS